MLASSEQDLQIFLNELSDSCDKNKMMINEEKSNGYKYLGLVLNENLSYEEMAKNVAKSASRALGIVIAKYKSLGGLPFNSYTKLYESIVWRTISYGAAVWGTRQFSCINTIQLRAASFFLGVGKYTPNAGMLEDTGWEPVLAKQWRAVTSHWSRLQRMTIDLMLK